MRIKELSLAIVMVILAVVFFENEEFNKDIGKYDNENIEVTETMNTNLLLVNKNNPIDSSYKPQNSTTPNIDIIGTSAYRSYESQKRVYNEGITLEEYIDKKL